VNLASQALLAVAVFAVVTGLAALAGAANLGTALGIGQLAFILVVIALVLRR